VNITLENIDLQNPDHVTHAIESLRAYASIPAAFLSTLTDISLCFDGRDTVMTPASTPAPTPVSQTTSAPENKLGIYGKTTRTFLLTMITRVQQQGSATLEEVASDMGIPLDSARAYLRNAGRTAAAYKVLLPVAPTWNPEKGCNEYRLM
jgi:hypothetical protein